MQELFMSKYTDDSKYEHVVHLCPLFYSFYEWDTEEGTLCQKKWYN